MPADLKLTVFVNTSTSQLISFIETSMNKGHIIVQFKDSDGAKSRPWAMTIMLVAQRKRIVKLDLAKPNRTMEELPLIGIHNVIAMDFDSETDCVFWADIDKDRIVKIAHGGNRQLRRRVQWHCYSQSNRVVPLLSRKVNLKSAFGEDGVEDQDSSSIREINFK